MLCQTGLASLKVCDRTPMITTPGVLESFGKSFLKSWQPFCAADKKKPEVFVKTNVCEGNPTFVFFLCYRTSICTRSPAGSLNASPCTQTISRSARTTLSVCSSKGEQHTRAHTEKVSSSFKTNRPCFSVIIWVFSFLSFPSLFSSVHCVNFSLSLSLLPGFTGVTSSWPRQQGWWQRKKGSDGV